MTSPTSNAVALVERLRVYAESDPDESRAGELRVGPMMLRAVCSSAADLIQSQAARIAELEGGVRGERIATYREAYILGCGDLWIDTPQAQAALNLAASVWSDMRDAAQTIARQARSLLSEKVQKPARHGEEGE